MSRKRERENPCFICNHYHNFEAGEPCSVCGHGPAAAVERAAPPSAFPTLVVPDLLYLGSYDHAARAELLKAMGVKRILNVRAPAQRGCTRAREARGRSQRNMRARTRAPARRSRAPAATQTVPECQNLYKNSFLYHTASATPDAPKQVPLDECVAFVGACATPAKPARPQRAAGERSAAARSAAATRAARSADALPRAEASIAAREPVLVHCMSGSSRCAPAAAAPPRAPFTARVDASRRDADLACCLPRCRCPAACLGRRRWCLRT